MGKSGPFKAWRVKSEITDRLKVRLKEERYHGSLTSYIEGILDKFADGILAENKSTPERAEFVAFEEKGQSVDEKRHKRAS